MTEDEIRKHDARRLWWQQLFEAAELLGVEQVADEELILCNRRFREGADAYTVAQDMWGAGRDPF